MKRYFVVLFAVCAFTPEAFAGNAGRPSLAVAGGEGGGQLPGGISKGIGIAKKRWLARNRSTAEIAAMRAIKQALDPSAILNPNVLLP